MNDAALDFAPVRPPTAAYPDRRSVAEWRDRVFVPTADGTLRVRFLNLEGVFIDAGGLQEMILPVAQGMLGGVYGNMALGVVTSDDAVAGFVTYLAREHHFPLYVSNSAQNYLASAQPVGELTPGEEDTIAWVRDLGGSTTSSEFSSAVGLEPAAASNRLSNVERKGYVFRVVRSRSEGDLFVDPRGPLESSMSHPSLGDIDVPEEIRSQVLALSEQQGKQPRELLGEAWRQFIESNKQRLDEEFEDVGSLIRETDTEGLTEYLTHGAADRARRKAARARSQDK